MRCNPSYWLLGLIPIALLSWLAIQLEHEGIEADLGRRAQESLARKGLQWAVPIFAGRDGALTGKAAEESEPNRALSIIRDTWGVRVVDNRTELLEHIERYLWSAHWRDGRVVLSGYVPNEEMRKEIAGIAAQAFAKAPITDEMKLARGAPEREVWLRAIAFSMKELAQLKRGDAELENLALSIAGEAPTPPVYKSIKTALASPLPGGMKLASEKITPPVASPFLWSAKNTGTQLMLGGYVPDEKLREQLFAQAKSLFPKLALVDRTEVAAGAPDGWSKAALVALTQLAGLKSGGADLKDRDMVFQGEAQDEATAAAVRKALRLDVPQSFKLAEQIRFPKVEKAAPENYLISVSADGTAVEIAGYVPGERDRGAILDIIKKYFPGRPVTDKLQLQPGAPSGWQECIVPGIIELSHLKTGKVLLNDKRLLLSGSTDDYAVAQSVPGNVKVAAPSCDPGTEIQFTGKINTDLSWSANNGGDGALVLEGDIPDEASRGILLDAAQKLFANAKAVDQMKVKAAPADPWNGVALRGLEQLSRLKSGRATLVKQALMVAGLADSEALAKDVRGALGRDLPAGYTAQDQIQFAQRKIEIIQEADRCQEMMREKARGGTINFDRAKADLTEDSASTLYALADIANECPAFRIEIEGHTDNEGTDERNQRLSDRRARAVVDFLVRAGVDSRRLTAVGYGSTRPVADNGTSDGRARNRRIDFTVKAN